MGWERSFSLSRLGELAELKADLQGDNKIKKKEAVKKIIANMTVGKDVRYVLVVERFNVWLPFLAPGLVR